MDKLIGSDVTNSNNKAHSAHAGSISKNESDLPKMKFYSEDKYIEKEAVAFSHIC